MAFIARGDAEKLEHLQGVIYVLSALVVILVTLLGLVTWMPKTRKDVSCTLTRHPVIQNRFVSLNLPIPPLKCHG